MAKDGQEPAGSARLELVDGVTFLHAEDSVVEAMLRGWERQQRGGRRLQPKTIEGRAGLVRRFMSYCNEYPWNWTAAHVDEWMTNLISEHGRAESTIRNYQGALRTFCEYLTNPAYSWVEECEVRFGTHPIQVVHEWNSAAHLLDYEGSPSRRPLTRDELQRFFDYADEQVDRATRLRRKGSLAAYRDATIVPVIEDYLDNIRSRFGFPDSSALWPTERGGRVRPREINDRFSQYRHALKLPEELTPHCLRHSWVTHLVEDGTDPRFVQVAAGHEYQSTTAIYTSVNGDFMNTMMRQTLDRAFAQEEEL